MPVTLAGFLLPSFADTSFDSPVLVASMDFYVGHYKTFAVADVDKLYNVQINSFQL